MAKQAKLTGEKHAFYVDRVGSTREDYQGEDWADGQLGRIETKYYRGLDNEQQGRVSDNPSGVQ